MRHTLGANAPSTIRLSLNHREQYTLVGTYTLRIAPYVSMFRFAVAHLIWADMSTAVMWI